jgi:hypothetical protein
VNYQVLALIVQLCTANLNEQGKSKPFCQKQLVSCYLNSKQKVLGELSSSNIIADCILAGKADG